ncbi:ferritin family protein [Candidatus Margulisiibacteriota bacterium]
MDKQLSLNDIFKAAMQMEAIGGAFYRKYAQVSGDPEIEKIFNSLAIMEESHFNKFQAMIEALKPEEAGKGISKENRGYVTKTINEVVFNEDRKPENLLQRVSSKQDALKIALELENGSISYYEKMKQEVAPEAAKEIDRIIGEEQGHAQTITSLLENLA